MDGTDTDERLRYLATIPHAQRTVLLLCASVVLAHPRGASIIKEIQRHHIDSDGADLCMHVVIELMISLAGKWDAGCAILLPLANVLDEAVHDAVAEVEPICPLDLAERLWAMVEQLHDQPLVESAGRTEPSFN